MSVYLTTWNLNKEGLAYVQAREDLIDAMDVFENEYHPSLDSVRFISTADSADELCRYLRSAGGLDNNDILVAVKIEKGTVNHQGNIGTELWQWINARI